MYLRQSTGPVLGYSAAVPRPRPYLALPCKVPRSSTWQYFARRTLVQAPFLPFFSFPPAATTARPHLPIARALTRTFFFLTPPYPYPLPAFLLPVLSCLLSLLAHNSSLFLHFTSLVFLCVSIDFFALIFLLAFAFASSFASPNSFQFLVAPSNQNKTIRHPACSKPENQRIATQQPPLAYYYLTSTTRDRRRKRTRQKGNKRRINTISPAHQGRQM